MSQERTSDTLEDAMALLISWNLPQLCETFREQEVCTDAFPHLTKNDITQLIPKIGPRAIFSARLDEWVMERVIANRKIEADQYNVESSDLLGSVKSEVKESNTSWLNDETQTPLNTLTTTFLAESSEDEQNRETTSNMEIVISNTATISKKRIKNVTTQPLINVREILKNNFYGVKALEYYKNHKSLDTVQRKKIVEIIISTVMEQHVVMSSQCFTDLAQQVINIFPNETIETYYTPRMNLTCPKGALYNKYLNMGKVMRRSGQLEYRVGRRGIKHTYSE